ncbi:MAG TPA: tyrosine-type recombinase/integrase [Chloroflexia bacterium]
MDFTPLSPTLRGEVKYAVWRQLSTQEWIFTKHSSIVSCVKRLIRVLVTHQVGDDSMMLRTISEWESLIQKGLIEVGDWRGYTRKYLTTHGDPRTSVAPDPVIYTLHTIYNVVNASYEELEGISEWDKDVWDIRKLRALEPAQRCYTLDFRSIRQPWLRRAAKAFLRYRLSNRAINVCTHDLLAIRCFSMYLIEHHPEVRPENIERGVLKQFVDAYKAKGRVASTVINTLGTLRIFLEKCVREGWAPLPRKRLIRDDDFPRAVDGKSRAIPDRTLRQLDSHLNSLPPEYRRMAHIIRNVGMRVGELLTLEMNCLRADTAGGKYLHFYQSKMSKDHNVPIRAEVGETILEQMRAVRVAFGNEMKWLFPSPKKSGMRPNRPRTAGWFIGALNELAREKNIVDEEGNIFHFQSHQFRHTIASDMANRDVPLKVIQVYLGHHSMKMTMRYARIRDETRKAKHLETQRRLRGTKYDVLGREVDMSGRLVSTPGSEADVSWVRKNILAQALPNGRCALPVIGQQRCPHANACLTCEHFRTSTEFLPVHKEQLAETTRIIQVAQANGWERQVQMNESVAGNLKQIIEALEQSEGEGTPQVPANNADENAG